MGVEAWPVTRFGIVGHDDGQSGLPSITEKLP